MSRNSVLVLTTILVAACSGAPNAPSTSSSGMPVETQAPLPSVGPGESLLQLAWQPNDDGVVAGYRVYYGTGPEETSAQASDLALSSPSFNARAPGIVYNAQRDLGLVSGQHVCFRLRAYNSQGTLSPWSAPVCGTV